MLAELGERLLMKSLVSISSCAVSMRAPVTEQLEPCLDKVTDPMVWPRAGKLMGMDLSVTGVRVTSLSPALVINVDPP